MTRITAYAAQISSLLLIVAIWWVASGIVDSRALPSPAAVFETLAGLILDRHVVVANPPYALLLQSKRLLKVLWERFEGHPLLLPAAYAPIETGRFVEKVAFGREGANVTVYDALGNETLRTPGDYDVYPSVFQAWADLPHDARVDLYQTGLVWAFEPCAIGFRKGGEVIGNASPFVGHVVE